MNTLKKAMKHAGAAGLGFLLTGCSAFSWVGLGGDGPKPAPPSAEVVASEAAMASRPVQPGDRIIVTSWRDDGASDTVSVDESGAVVLPLLGRRTVTDVPANELKPTLVKDYEAQFRNHTVGVTLLRRVSVLGAVEDPGIYYVDPTVAVGGALALAGGPTDNGKEDEVYIQRPGETQRIPVARQAFLQAYVDSGDQIVVPRRPWLSRNALFILGTTVSAATIVLTRVVF